MNYELIGIKNDQGLYQIRALKDIPKYGVIKGDVGGFVEGLHNLSLTGDAWIDISSKVYGEAVITSGYVGFNSVVTGKFELKGGMIENCTISADGYAVGASLKTSRLYEEIIIEGDVTISNSIVRDCTFKGKGLVSFSSLEKIQLLELYEIESSSIRARFGMKVRGSQKWKQVMLEIHRGEMKSDMTMNDVKGKIINIEFYQNATLEHIQTEKEVICLKIGGMTPNTGKTEIAGYSSDEPVNLNVHTLNIQDSHIQGNVTLKGYLTISQSTIQDYVKISMFGSIEQSVLSEFAIIHVARTQKQAIFKRNLHAEDVYTTPF